MSIFPKLLARRSKNPPPSDDFWYTQPQGDTSSGISVSEADALKYLTVYACVSLISGDLARLPLILYKKYPDGSKERMIKHPLYDLLHTKPNDETTSFNWREAAESHLLLWGNHYSELERSNDNTIVNLWQLPNPGAVKVIRRSNRLFYTWRDENGREIVKPKDDMLHIPGFGFNGVYGQSMIAMAREAIGMGLAAEEFGGRYFGNGTHPTGVLEMEEYLGDDEERFKKDLKTQYAGLGKSHNVMLLQGGMKYRTMTVPLEDAQFLETRDHQKTEICGMYHVPPHKIALHGANSNYNNLEQENQGYVDSCLMHWLVRWEQGLSHQLLTTKERRDGLFFEFLVDGMLRGDSETRGNFYNKLWQMGALSPDEIRAKENMNPLPADGDQYFVPLNFIPLDQAGVVAEQERPPVPAPEPTEEKKLITEIETRSITARDRIVRQYYPMFLRSAQSIVDSEADAVKAKVTNLLRYRADTDDMRDWLHGFYRKQPDQIKNKIGPVFRAFMAAIIAAATTEIGVDEDDLGLDTWVAGYIDRYAERHVDSSLGQLLSLLEDDIEELDQRADEWQEKRAEKIAMNETTRASNGVFQAVAFAVGMSTVWRIRGPKTCPYCKELNGRRVSRGQYFAKAGQSIDPATGNGPMKINGMKAHPPLHRGCDCYLTI